MESRAYLRFIDGLRFVAVSLVLLYHAGFVTIGGGYVGVDVFFVISGFLITRICAAEQFSFQSFFTARIRRILPSYLLTILAIVIVSAVLYLPKDLETVSRHALTSIAFLQNFSFWKERNYFAAGFDNPLLHTWSLAVEWQFYMILPFIVAPLRRQPGRLALALGGIAAFSFAASCWGAYHKPTPTFFLMPFRIWEFVLGGGVGLLLGRFPLAVIHPATSWAGLAMIMAAALAYDDHTIFPGFAALLPCSGAALILAGGGHGKWNLHALLSLAPVSLLGRASYSIYLVHWPLLVFFNYVFPVNFSPSAALLLCGLSVGLGTLQWAFIEQPFRPPAAGHSWRRAALAAMLTSSVASLALVGLMTGGMPGRFAPDVLAMAGKTSERGRFRDCLSRGVGAINLEDFCRVGDDRATTPTFIVWGDSFGDALLEGLDVEARRMGRSGIFIGTDSCPPLVGFPGLFAPSRPLCDHLQEIMATVIEGRVVEHVIIAAAWRGYARSDTELFMKRLDTTLGILGRARINSTLFGVIPGATANVPVTKAKAMAWGFNYDLRIGGETRVEIEQLDREIEASARKAGHSFVKPTRVLCKNDCEIDYNGNLIYFDWGHLSPFGSMLVVQQALRTQPSGLDQFLK